MDRLVSSRPDSFELELDERHQKFDLTNMDILHLPPALRRSILHNLAPFTRTFATNTFTPERPPPPPDTLSSYTTTLPPTAAALKFSASFFHSTPPTLLYTSSTFRQLPPSPIPEIAFLGRSNVGKSSLLNALFGRPHARDAHVSKRPGRTRTINGFGVSGGEAWGAAPGEGERGARWKRFPRGGVVVVDMPGYGAGSREEWGAETMKFLERRRQLRRCFVLVDAEHGLKASDVQLLTHLRRSGIGFSVVLSKVDKILWAGSRAPGPERLANKTVVIAEMCEKMRRRLDAEAGDGRKRDVDVLCCSSEKSLEGMSRFKRIGIDEVRWAALSACGIEVDEMGRRKGGEEVFVQPDGAETTEASL